MAESGETSTVAVPGDAVDGRRTWHYESPAAAAAAADTAGTTAGAGSGPLDVLLFYKYVELDAPAIATWQSELCTSLGLSGRVLVGPEGVNGSLAGPAAATAKYIAAMQAHPSFGGIDWKHSEAAEEPFPDFHCKVVKEIISTGGVVPNDFSNAGVHLSPQDFHRKLEAASADDSVILDVRNYKEYRCEGGEEAQCATPQNFHSTSRCERNAAAVLTTVCAPPIPASCVRCGSVGHFDGAMRSDMRVFSEFPRFIDNNLDKFAGKQVMMYCTGESHARVRATTTLTRPPRLLSAPRWYPV